MLEPGEMLLGGVTSTRLARGRLPGYGVYFTNKRIIGVKRRSPALAIYLILLGVLVVFFIFSLLANPLSFLYGFVVPLMIPVANAGFRALSNSIVERVMIRGDSDMLRQLRRTRDFDIRREQIMELGIHPPSSSFFGTRKGIFNIRVKQYGTSIISLNVNGWNQYHKLKDLILAFSKIQQLVNVAEW
ncbi:MAG TPA: hypothetical protein VFE98_10005 [Candidatus Bathyarchaeia archaeon]|nr:hypothetical protein [Candidatus Bathyarchaeia archaeon]